MFVSSRYAPPDYLYFDFRLDSVSPARNIGDKLTAKLLPTDRLGNSRLEDEGPDAGCYEWKPEAKEE